MNLNALTAIYDRFAAETRERRAGAVCKVGCAFCCTEMGTVDLTTLEGMMVRDHLAALPRQTRRELEKRVAADLRRRLKGESGPCPFLANDHICRIYPARPFSCRQLYSVRRCGPDGPAVHRAVVKRAQAAIGALQRLDRNGYSGHMSAILDLLKRDDFRRFYREGGFDPARIADLGKAYRLTVHRFVAER